MSTGEGAPDALQGDLHDLPEAFGPLLVLPNWVCWKWVCKTGKQGAVTWSKVPFQPRKPEAFARNNDPATWGTYEQALSVFAAGKCTGIGFNLSGTEYAAFDIDNCRDRDTGVIAPEARAILDEATSYTEITVSGTGLRVIGLAKGAALHRRLKVPDSVVEVETYRNAERYIVVTGNPLPGTWPHLANIDEALDAVVRRLDGARTRQEKKADGGFDWSARPLPEKLSKLIEEGVPPHEDRSAAFHHAVRWLHELGYRAGAIESLIAGKPIVPERYSDRLAGEIARSLGKAKPQQDEPRWGEWEESRQASGKSPLELLWHGDADGRQARSWLVHDLIPAKGHGLASGQWGAAKTFAMIDLCTAVMTGQSFAGREVVRKGGVLFVAAEGAYEIPIRLQGVIDHKVRTRSDPAGATFMGGSLEKLPFAWIEDDPSLKDDMERIVAAANAAAARMREQFGLPLVLIVFDTLNAVARFKDGNDAAEAQLVMNQLSRLGKATDAFVLAVDHFGKASDTGTRGSSAKEASADVVLAFLADRDIAGNIDKTRMSVRKLRGGKTGNETSFDLKVVDVAGGETTCIIEWSSMFSQTGTQSAKRDRWTKPTKLLRATLIEVLIAEGKHIDPFGDGKMKLKAVVLASVQKEFSTRYIVNGDDAAKKADAKRKAFTRAIRNAQDLGLIACREIGGVEHVWLTDEGSGT